ncbi:MAG: DUF5004 domain-containing protein [Sphingobacteriaceae bacterium]|nr:MAG: DUF5004 domain-containing protein [Sphingobacteriaceae bacterium]
MMKKFNRFTKINIFLCLILVTVAVSCKVEKKGSYKNEMEKDISGSWKIKAATRNGVDLKALAPEAIEAFRVTFSGGNKFTLTNPVPFLALKNGSYSFDDPITPFQITLTAEGGTPATTPFSYPVNSGVRNISLVFSSGCSLNTYVYTLEKATN